MEVCKMRTRSKRHIYWGAIVLDTIKNLIITDRLDGNTMRVFLYLCYEMKTDDNIFYSKQIEIANKLTIHRSSVSKSIKKLIEKQYIKKIPGKGFMVNPNLFYVNKKSWRDREDLREIFDKDISLLRFELDEEDGLLTVNDEYDTF